jgi:hypothetical protein
MCAFWTREWMLLGDQLFINLLIFWLEYQTVFSPFGNCVCIDGQTNTWTKRHKKYGHAYKKNPQAVSVREINIVQEYFADANWMSMSLMIPTWTLFEMIKIADSKTLLGSLAQV